MDYIDIQHWTDGVRCRHLNEIKGGRGSDNEESYRTRKERERILASYLAEEPEEPAPVLNGSVAPQRNTSLIEWRQKTMKSMKPIGTTLLPQTASTPRIKRIPKESTDKAPKKARQPLNRRRIIRLDTGEIYSSSLEAAAALGKTDGGTIRSAANSRGKKTAYGTAWLYEGDELDTSAPVQKEKTAGGYRKKTPLRNIDTGEIFSSLTAVTKLENTTTTMLYYHLQHSGIVEINHHRYQYVVDEAHTEPTTEVNSELCQLSSHEDA